MAGFATLLVAAAALSASDGIEPIATVQAVSNAESSVLVARGSGLYALSANDQLFAGDKVFTRTDGTATIFSNDCVVTLEPVSVVVLGDTLCGSDVASISDSTDPNAAPGASRFGRAGALRGAAASSIPATGATISSRRTSRRRSLSP